MHNGEAGEGEHEQRRRPNHADDEVGRYTAGTWWDYGHRAAVGQGFCRLYDTKRAKSVSTAALVRTPVKSADRAGCRAFTDVDCVSVWVTCGVYA